jgi:arylsulfatase A-like enzyme
MNRRTFLALAGLPALAQTPSSRPNVLMICVDDLNDWIGCLGGNPDSVTPNFDRLASRSTLFTNAHCAAPLCNPSRAALLTGIRPSTSGVYQNDQPWRQSPVLAKTRTLPQHFMDHGYKAIGTGKTFHDSYPDPESWLEYYPSKTQQKPPDPKPATIPASGLPPMAQFDWGPTGQDDSAQGDHKVVDWAVDQLSKKHDKPLFLAVGLFRPHLPWYVPKKYFDMYPLDKITLPKVNGDDLDDVPAIGKRFAKPDGDHRVVTENNKWKEGVRAYLACIRYTDTELGRLLDGLDRSPYANNTAVVLWSDHGWHLGEKLHWRKFTLWEEATHNVLMMSVPGLTKAGSRCDRTVSLLDVFPTLTDVCGLSAKKECEGVSLRPLLKDPKTAWERGALTTYGRNNHAIRTEKWRYIRYSDGGEELYDRDRDPMEWKNLAADPQFAKIKQDLAKWLPRENAAEVGSRKKG